MQQAGQGAGRARAGQGRAGHGSRTAGHWSRTEPAPVALGATVCLAVERRAGVLAMEVEGLKRRPPTVGGRPMP